MSWQTAGFQVKQCVRSSPHLPWGRHRKTRPEPVCVASSFRADVHPCKCTSCLYFGLCDLTVWHPARSVYLTEGTKQVQPCAWKRGARLLAAYKGKLPLPVWHLGSCFSQLCPTYFLLSHGRYGPQTGEPFSLAPSPLDRRDRASGRLLGLSPVLSRWSWPSWDHFGKAQHMLY